MRGYSKNGKIIIRHSYYDHENKKYKIVNFPTGIKVKYWNQKDQQAENDGIPSLQANSKFLVQCEIIQGLILKYPPLIAREKYAYYKMHYKFTEDKMAAKWTTLLSDLYSEYYDKYKDEKKIRKVKEHQRNWIDKYYSNLKAYKVDRKWFSEYMGIISHLANNTQRDHVKILKRVLREARRSGHSLNINEDELRNPPAQKKKVVWLNLQELKKLEKVETLSIMEKKAIDCWLFRAYTGLRHNEMNQIDIKKLLEGFIDINDTKKRSVKSIEVPQPAINILKRNNGKLPVLSQQSENVLIKRLSKRANLNRIVYTSLVMEKKYQQGEFELNQTITTHDARRTFASICYREFNLSLEVVRELLQHSSTDQTLEYIGESIRTAKIGGLFK